MQLNIMPEPPTQRERSKPLTMLPDVAESNKPKQTADPQVVLANDVSSVDQRRLASEDCTPESRSLAQTPATLCK